MEVAENITRRFALTSEELESFQKNGFIGPFTLYSPEQMKEEWRKARLRLRYALRGGLELSPAVKLRLPAAPSVLSRCFPWVSFLVVDLVGEAPVFREDETMGRRG